jgi:hypothetical protein
MDLEIRDYRPGDEELVETGHAPARRVYEKADYRLIPLARYFKAL